MAGGSTAGPGEARADLFDGRPWFIVSGGADARAVTRVRTLVQALGAEPVLMPDDGSEHDRVMAAVSHLPQVVASALMATVGTATASGGLEWAGNGLRDTTRLAESSPDMWASIVATNRDYLAPLLAALARDLHALAGRLDDREAVRALLTTGSEQRRRLADTRPKG